MTSPISIANLPKHPLPLDSPIYTCGHKGGYLPRSASCRGWQPLTLAHPCCDCHLNFTCQLAKAIKARFKDTLDRCDAKMLSLRERTAPELEGYVAQSLESYRLKKVMEEAKQDRELKAVWKSFSEIWEWIYTGEKDGGGE